MTLAIESAASEAIKESGHDKPLDLLQSTNCYTGSAIMEM